MSGRTDVYVKLADGRTQVRVWDARRKAYKSHRASSKGEAVRWAKEQHATMASGAKLAKRGTDTTVGDELHRWLEHGREAWQRPGTYRERCAAVRNRFPQWLTATVVTELEVDAIEAWVAELARKYAPRTVNQTLGMLSQVLDKAVKARRLGFNPARMAEGVSEGGHVHTEAMSHEAVLAMRDAMPAPYRIGVELAYGLGLRLGEVLGLTIDRVDFLRRTVTVDRQWARHGEGNGESWAPPKSKARTVPVSQRLLEAINAHMDAHKLGDGGLIVHRDANGPMTHSQWQYVWRVAAKRTGLTEWTTHSLRHAFGSRQLAAGHSTPNVALWMGHTPMVLMRTYAHHEADAKPVDTMAPEMPSSAGRSHVLGA